MDSILKKLIKIKDNLSLCTIKFVNKKIVKINIDGYQIERKEDIDKAIIWQESNEKIDFFESTFLECTITPYIKKLEDISHFLGYSILEREFSLEDIQNIYYEKNILYAV